MAAEMGAKNALCCPDAVTRAWLAGRPTPPTPRSYPDPDAHYVQVLHYELPPLVPQVAKPHRWTMWRRYDGRGRTHNRPGAHRHLYQTSPGRPTRRQPDPARASRLRRGCVCGSAGVAPRYVAAMASGVIADLVAAGATLINPGCGPCLGAHEGSWHLASGPSPPPTATSRADGQPRRRNLSRQPATVGPRR